MSRGPQATVRIRWWCMPHGGPHGIRDVWEFDPEVQLLANRGYAVLQVNFRGSGGYGMDFEHAGYRRMGREDAGRPHRRDALGDRAEDRAARTASASTASATAALQR